MGRLGFPLGLPASGFCLPGSRVGGAPALLGSRGLLFADLLGLGEDRLLDSEVLDRLGDTRLLRLPASKDLGPAESPWGISTETE